MAPAPRSAAMDFFDRQDKAHRNTKLLTVYFVLGVVLLVAAIYVASLLIFSVAASGHRSHGAEGPLAFWNAKLFFGVAIGTLAVILGGSAFKTLELSKGGSSVATMLGGRLLNPNATNPDERKLLNVVEEMALASGVPVPQVYVMDEEKGINAFAAGHSTSDAVIGVTRGCMKLLSRDELQGVIGHEFSHILNGDMRLNLRLIGLVFGIVCITVVGRILLRSGTRTYYRLGARNRGGNPLPLLGLALIVIGGIGVLFGRLIQAAVSRQREFLADASSVQFTRNPEGLAGALKKIGGLAYGSRLQSAHAEEASHMFFGNGMGEAWFGLMATHPPLAERILAIDPSFDGKFRPVSATDEERPGAPIPAKAQPRGQPPVIPVPIPFPGMRGAPGMAGWAQQMVAAGAVMPATGSPTEVQLRYAQNLRGSFPPKIQTAARDPLGAAALVYSLLISAEPELRERQLNLLASATSHSVRQETERLLPEVAQVAKASRLPLVDLSLPALKHLSPSQYQQFTEAIRKIIESDNEVDLFEYVLQKITLRHLDPHFTQARKPVLQYYALRPLAADCAVLLSAMAHIGSDDAAAAQQAFIRGAQELSRQAQTALALVPETACDLPQVDAALNRLNQAVPQIKKNVLNACAQTLAADGVIQEMEAELLRGIADTLDCPIPPFAQPNS